MLTYLKLTNLRLNIVKGLILLALVLQNSLSKSHLNLKKFYTSLNLWKVCIKLIKLLLCSLFLLFKFMVLSKKTVLIHLDFLLSLKNTCFFIYKSKYNQVPLQNLL